jgi:hypothetical protein
MSLSNYLWSGPVTGLASIRNSATTVLRPYVLVRADVNTDAIAPPNGSNGAHCGSRRAPDMPDHERRPPVSGRDKGAHPSGTPY